MGKIILEFDSVEERSDARIAIDAYKWQGVVWDLDQELRKIVRHGFIDQKEATEDERALAEKIREKLRGFLEDVNLNLDE